MTVARYVIGWLYLGALIAPSVAFASALRAWLVPSFSGARARLAEILIVIAHVLTMAQLLGMFGLFKMWPLLAAVWVTSLPAAILLRGCNTGTAGASKIAATRAETAVGFALVAVPVSRWTAGVYDALTHGPRGIDTLVYHLPMAARFFQTGSVYRLHYTLPEYLIQFVPFAGESVHTIGMIAFHHDLLSPLVNLGWFALVLLAAWCCGAEFGLGPHALGAACIVLATPVLARTQPGAGLVDMPGLFLVLCAAAFLLDDDSGIGGSALAAVAMGLALGAKSALVVPALAMFVGALVVARRGERRKTGLVWLLAVAATGSYSYLRNLIVVGNPFPGVTFRVGSWTLPSPRAAAIDNRGFTVFHYIARPSVWRKVFIPQLSLGFSKGWPVVAAVAVGGIAAALIAGRGRLRMLGGVCLAGAVGYLFLPASAGGPEGTPFLFAANLRWLTPMLVLAAVLLPIALPRLRAVVLVVIGLAVLASVTTAVDPGLAPAPRVVTGAAVLVVLAIAAYALWRTVPGAGTKAAVAVVCVLAIAVGWPVQRRYIDHRYAEAHGPIDAAYAWARHVRDSRIGIALNAEQYPLDGLDLSNYVQLVGVIGPHKAFHTATSCSQWRRSLRDGRYTYVVTAPYGDRGGEPAEAAWTRSDPAAVLVLRAASVSVFRIDGRVNPAACA